MMFFETFILFSFYLGFKSIVLITFLYLLLSANFQKLNIHRQGQHHRQCCVVAKCSKIIF